uniref:Alternative protein SUPT6H n=1 Tax=Homo sapiens TaxID=9606 RepID=L8E7F9_HUMAN|nr:alternative protein SUPT6H [Homo sapiens]
MASTSMWMCGRRARKMPSAWEPLCGSTVRNSKIWMRLLLAMSSPWHPLPGTF